MIRRIIASNWLIKIQVILIILPFAVSQVVRFVRKPYEWSDRASDLCVSGEQNRLKNPYRIPNERIFFLTHAGSAM